MKIFNLLQSYLDLVTNKMKYFQLKQAHKSYLSFKILKIYTHVLFILICWNKILVSNRTIQPICFTDVKATLTLFICMLFTKCYSLLRQKHFIIFNEIPYIHFCHCHKTMICINLWKFLRDAFQTNHEIMTKISTYQWIFTLYMLR